MKCWYCGKRIKPCSYDYVVTINGELRPVCHDDRTCRSGTGIMGRGTRPPKKRQAKNKTLQKARERHET